MYHESHVKASTQRTLTPLQSCVCSQHPIRPPVCSATSTLAAKLDLHIPTAAVFQSLTPYGRLL